MLNLLSLGFINGLILTLCFAASAYFTGEGSGIGMNFIVMTTVLQTIAFISINHIVQD